MRAVETLSTDSTVLAASCFRIEVASEADDKGFDRKSYQRVNLYFLEGDLSLDQILTLGHELLADPVVETFSVSAIDHRGYPLQLLHEGRPIKRPIHTIEVTLLPGVTDPTAENLVRAAHLLGVTPLQGAATGQRYLLYEALSKDALERLAVETFSNPVIQRAAIDRPIAPPFVSSQYVEAVVEVIPLRDADNNRLLAVSTTRRLALNLQEMLAVRDYYRREGRDPTDVELEMLAQTWSEHCIHKTFRAVIDYTGPAPGAPPDSPPVTQTINGLLNTYIRGATEKVAKPWLRSAFVDNAGIVAFDDVWDLAFKVETHNHPSALEPFGGANTGVGGVVRDILGVSARPIANTDVLCFGPQDTPASELAEGVLHPKRIAEGVVRGIEDYGNKMGIPTVNGAILYHPGYTANPLVFCGCLGLLPHGSHPTGAQPGDLIVVIGGRTGRDGLRGATFSSMEMDVTTSEVAGSAVQIGHPIHEKQVQEVILRLRDERLYHAITDCGAGGLSSAVGETAKGLGARVYLENVPLKYPGLRPWEIWLSEAQERMVLAVPPDAWTRVQAICAGQDVEAACIGEFHATGRLLLYYEEEVVGRLSVDFLHDGISQRHLQAEWTAPPQLAPPTALPPSDLTQTLLTLLSHPNIRSKEDVIRRYDHEVQGGTAVKPLVGADNHGPGDAAVIVPLEIVRRNPSPQPPPCTQGGGEKTDATLDITHAQETTRAIALSVGICPAYGEIDPYAMAWAAVDEALRNLVAVGADPDQVAILDNFCWGNPNLPDRLGALVRCAQGCHDAALAYGVPFISGKDSLNNEYADGSGQRHAIPGTLLISGLGIVPDANKTVTMDLKQPGNRLYVVGETRAEMGGSHFHLVHGLQGGTVPQPNPGAIETMRRLHRAIRGGLVQSCHDVSEGGVAIALAEMCIAGRLGARIELQRLAETRRVNDPAVLLFSESLSRFIVEVSADNEDQFLQTVGIAACQRIGEVLEDAVLHVAPEAPDIQVIKILVVDLEQAWRGESVTSPIESIPPVTARQPLRRRTPIARITLPRALILHANGTNRDREAALACELAGAAPEIVHVNQLLDGERRLLDYHFLIVPGGFSYGDDLGAGRLWALDLRERLGSDLARFIAQGRPVLGICNGFQALVKSGLLPGHEWLPDGGGMVTLTRNASSRFECRWVYLQPQSHSPCLFIEGLDEPIYCPVAHGEGRLVTVDQDTLDELWSAGLAALTYTSADGTPAAYPANPNGSSSGIAGLCNREGNVFGLMPHPEDHIFPWQHPRWHRGERGMDGLRLFKNGVKYA